MSSITNSKTPLGGASRKGSNNGLVQPGGFGGGGKFTLADIIDGQHGIATEGVDYFVYGSTSQSSITADNKLDVKPVSSSGTTSYTFDIPSDWEMCRFQLYAYFGLPDTTQVELFGSTALSASVLATTVAEDAICLSSCIAPYFSGSATGPFTHPNQIISQSYTSLKNTFGSFINGDGFVSTCYKSSAANNVCLSNLPVTAYIQSCWIENSLLNVVFAPTLNNAFFVGTFPANQYVVVISRVPT